MYGIAALDEALDLRRKSSSMYDQSLLATFYKCELHG